MELFCAVLETLNTKGALEAAGCDEFDWKAIFNHAVVALDGDNSLNLSTKFSTTQPFAFVTMIKSSCAGSDYSSICTFISCLPLN